MAGGRAISLALFIKSPSPYPTGSSDSFISKLLKVKGEGLLVCLKGRNRAIIEMYSLPSCFRCLPNRSMGRSNAQIDIPGVSQRIQGKGRSRQAKRLQQMNHQKYNSRPDKTEGETGILSTMTTYLRRTRSEIDDESLKHSV